MSIEVHQLQRDSCDGDGAGSRQCSRDKQNPLDKFSSQEAVSFKGDKVYQETVDTQLGSAVGIP